MATVEELKSIIVDLKVEVVSESIPSGHCPYVYYNRENPDKDCNSVSCRECKEMFLEDMKKEFAEEVKAL